MKPRRRMEANAAWSLLPLALLLPGAALPCTSMLSRAAPGGAAWGLAARGLVPAGAASVGVGAWEVLAAGGQAGAG